VQMTAATTPTQRLTSNARSTFPLSPGQVRVSSKIVSGNERTNAGKKKPIPRSVGCTQLSVCRVRPEAANRRKCIPIDNPPTAREHIKSSPRTLDQKATSGFLKSLSISKANSNGSRLVTAAIVPSIPAVMRLAIVVTTILSMREAPRTERVKPIAKAALMTAPTFVLDKRYPTSAFKGCYRRTFLRRLCI
jgi:hypothetical protein